MRILEIINEELTGSNSIINSADRVHVKDCYLQYENIASLNPDILYSGCYFHASEIQVADMEQFNFCTFSACRPKIIKRVPAHYQAVQPQKY